MPNSITIAQHAGFCFGVKRATDAVEKHIEERKNGERIFTLGHLIHNAPYNQMLKEKGVESISMEDVDRIAGYASAESPVIVFVRAHGIPRGDEERLKELAEQRTGFSYVDCTCPYVKKIHRIAEENSAPDNLFVLFGSDIHPEVIGIMSYFEGEKIVLGSADEIEQKKEFFEKNKNKKSPPPRSGIPGSETVFLLQKSKIKGNGRHTLCGKGEGIRIHIFFRGMAPSAGDAEAVQAGNTRRRHIRRIGSAEGDDPFAAGKLNLFEYMIHVT
jgi:hypothetical protein